MSRSHRHAFRFKVRTNDGQEQILVAWAKVVRATKPVELHLTADHVRRSIKLMGSGNSMTCPMAVCTTTQRQKFQHPVVGHVDWFYHRAYVASKIGKATGLPIACVLYGHNDDIAKLNDTKGGQKKLLKELETNGDRVIKLYPVKKDPYRPGRPKGQRDGSRTSRPAAMGAKLRFAMANLGGVPA